MQAQRAAEAGQKCCVAQVRSLILDADPLALTEHAQFYRQPEACKVRGRAWG